MSVVERGRPQRKFLACLQITIVVFRTPQRNSNYENRDEILNKKNGKKEKKTNKPKCFVKLECSFIWQKSL